MASAYTAFPLIKKMACRGNNYIDLLIQRRTSSSCSRLLSCSKAEPSIADVENTTAPTREYQHFGYFIRPAESWPW